MGPLYWTCFVSPFWRPQFWSGWRLHFCNNCAPLVQQLLPVSLADFEIHKGDKHPRIDLLCVGFLNCKFNGQEEYSEDMRKLPKSFVRNNQTNIPSNWTKCKKVKQSHYRPGRALRVPEGWGSQISRHSAHEGGKVVSPTHRPPLPPRNIPGTHFCKRLSQPQHNSAAGKIPVTPSGIELATFRLVAQFLNQLSRRMPLIKCTFN